MVGRPLPPAAERKRRHGTHRLGWRGSSRTSSSRRSTLVRQRDLVSLRQRGGTESSTIELMPAARHGAGSIGNGAPASHVGQQEQQTIGPLLHLANSLAQFVSIDSPRISSIFASKTMRWRWPVPMRLTIVTRRSRVPVLRSTPSTLASTGSATPVTGLAEASGEAVSASEANEA